MDYYAGLDVSLEETSVCVVDGDGADVHEAKVATEVEAIAETLRRFARSLAGVGIEAGPLYQRSLAIRERALGPEHPDVATSLENYATLLRLLRPPRLSSCRDHNFLSRL